MEMSRVTSKYQATVPADVRAALGVSAGDRLIWEVDGDVARVRRIDAGTPMPNATLIDSQSFGEWLSPEDEDAWRDYQPR
jgi:antitoxin PrlF